MLSTLGASLLGNLLISKGVIQAGEGMIKGGEWAIGTSQGRGMIKAGQDF